MQPSGDFCNFCGTMKGPLLQKKTRLVRQWRLFCDTIPDYFLLIKDCADIVAIVTVNKAEVPTYKHKQDRSHLGRRVILLMKHNKTRSFPGFEIFDAKKRSANKKTRASDKNQGDMCITMKYTVSDNACPLVKCVIGIPRRSNFPMSAFSLVTFW